MLYHILAVGDVVMEPGLRHLERHLRPLQKWKAIDFTVVNGENAAGVGLTRDQAERIYDAGADVVTLGNHAFGKSQIADFLEDAPWLLRPANYTGRAPGRGCGVYDLGGVCPFALPEDVKVYLDVSMKRFETVFPAAGSSNSAVEMTCDELERYASNFAAWVDVCKGWRPEEQG